MRGVEVDTGSAAEIDSAPPVGLEYTGFSSGAVDMISMDIDRPDGEGEGDVT